jgi:ribonuclease T1
VGWTTRSVWLGSARRLGLASLIALSAVAAGGVEAKGVMNPVMDGAAAVALSTLPSEAQQTHRLIHLGGPFRSSKDGTIFGNRERLLPRRERGYYREYTVPTPGVRNRGARRIVCGGTPPTHPEACYYTDDHYGSFKLIAQ